MKRQQFIQAKEEEIIHEFVKLYGEDQRERLFPCGSDPV